MAMAAEGATVWATDVNPELLKSYAGVANVHTAVLDVMNKDDIQKQVALIPRIDALFNCAGVVHSGTILQATDKDWDFAFSLNARAQFWMIQAVLPKMLEHGQCVLQRKGFAKQVHLWRVQSRRHWPDQKRGCRLCHQGHSLQCHLSWHCRNTLFA
jgi:NADP-dependent 3-hydroxy acid dehydrogenase YdfG